MSESLIYKIAISSIPKIGPVNAKNLISYIGSIEGIFKEKKSTLKKVPGIGAALANYIYSDDYIKKAEKEIEFITKYNIGTVFYLDKNYPERLKECYDAPLLLYYKGTPDFNPGKAISIVGTRNATKYGKDVCTDLIKQLKERGHNPVIISGLAYGIDITAHKAALKFGLQTYAILGHGLDIIYPAVHRDTAKKIINQGALITEFSSNSIRDRKNFVRRNRIIAGMSDATIVIESGVKGGALITADISNSYNRDVLAVPGNINNEYSKGCNQLIKSNRAALIEKCEDIEYILGWDTQKQIKQPLQKKIIPDLSENEKLVYNLFETDNNLSFDLIRRQTGLSSSETSINLLELEFKGLIKSLPGKVYQKCRHI